MKVVEGKFGAQAVDVEEATTLAEMAATVLKVMEVDKVVCSEEDSITMIVNAGGMFSVTSSTPEMNFVLAELSKATHLAQQMFFEGGMSDEE
jgi:hypothetical protein